MHSGCFAGNYTVTLLFFNQRHFLGVQVNAAIAMKALMLANILNMILDPIFIFGWGNLYPPLAWKVRPLQRIWEEE
jgi:Na+-driven multidrug efflux pump